MRKSKTIKIDDREITVKELTAGQIKAQLEGLGGSELSDIDLMFPDKLPARSLIPCTGLTESKLMDFVPGELEVLLDAVEEVNPTFASLIKRLAELGEKSMEAKILSEQEK